MSKINKLDLDELIAEVDREVESVGKWIAMSGIAPARRRSLFEYEADLYSIRQMFEMGIHKPEQIYERFAEVKEMYKDL